MLVIICIWALFFGPANEERVVAPLAALRRERDPAASLSLAVLTTNGQQVLVLGMVAFAVGAEVVVDEPAEPAGTAAVVALFGGIIICVTALWLFLARATGRRAWVSLAVSDTVLVGLALVSALAGLPGMVVIGLLLVAAASTVWGFSRETRRLAR